MGFVHEYNRDGPKQGLHSDTRTLDDVVQNY